MADDKIKLGCLNGSRFGGPRVIVFGMTSCGLVLGRLRGFWLSQVFLSLCTELPRPVRALGLSRPGVVWSVPF